MIDLKDVCKTYDTGTKALQHIDIHVDDGEFVFIMGRSGSGKSTLLHLLLKELEPSEGDIQVGEYELGKLKRRKIPNYRRQLGVVFQDFRLLKDLNVYDNVAFAQRVIGVNTAKIRETVPEVLRMVGLSGKYKSLPNQLSGGEQQRVAIARAIINKPKVLLADEPTGNLDSRTADDIMGLLDEINKQGTTVVVITHSRDIVEKMHKRVITLDRGIISSDKKADTDEA